MADDTPQLMTANDAAKLLGISPLYVRILARSKMLPAQSVGGRSGQWTGNNESDQRATIWLVDPRRELRDWLTYAEAAEALGVERSDVQLLVRRKTLQAIETGDPRLKVVKQESLEALRTGRARHPEGDEPTHR